MLKSLPKGAGMTGAAMTIQAMREAKKRKPTGRVNVDDIVRVKQMMSSRRISEHFAQMREQVPPFQNSKNPHA